MPLPGISLAMRAMVVFAAALPTFSHAGTLVSPRNNLIHNSSNVFDDAPAALQRRWERYLPEPQPASDKVWDYYVHKGKKLIAQMRTGPESTMESPYSKESLSKWGYELVDHVDPDYCDFGEATGIGQGISSFLRRLGVSTKCVEDEGTWHAALITHRKLSDQRPITEQTYKGPDGIIRPATGAFFHMAVTHEGGIITQDLKSPWVALKQIHPDATPADLPGMQRSSDMMWAMWTSFVPTKDNYDVGFFMSIGITNPTTLSLMRRGVDTLGEKLSKKFIKVDADTDLGAALLGSPNGAGFAYFLIQHKAYLKQRTIKQVFLVECQDNFRTACLIYIT